MNIILVVKFALLVVQLVLFGIQLSLAGNNDPMAIPLGGLAVLLFIPQLLLKA
jgi:hypothetical protein